MQEINDMITNQYIKKNLKLEDEEPASLIEEMVRSLVRSINPKNDKNYEEKLKNLYEMLLYVDEFVIEEETIKKNKPTYKRRFDFDLFIYKLLKCGILNDLNLKSFCNNLDGYNKKLEKNLEYLKYLKFLKKNPKFLDYDYEHYSELNDTSKREIEKHMNRKKRTKGIINNIEFLLCSLGRPRKTKDIIKELNKTYNLENQAQQTKETNDKKSIFENIKFIEEKHSRPKSADVKTRNQIEF